MKESKVNIENVNLKEGINELIIRFGDAPKIFEPKALSISGTIETPFRFLEKRAMTFSHSKAHLTVSKEKLMLVLVIDESHELKGTVTGKLEEHPGFELLGINKGRYITPLEMSEKIKMNRSLFENHQQAMELVTALKSFRAKVDKQVEQYVDLNKGDRRLSKIQAVETNLPGSFIVSIPLFKGFSKVSFMVETYFNPEDLTCTLVSPDANDLMHSLTDSILESEIGRIRELAPELVIIEI